MKTIIIHYESASELGAHVTRFRQVFFVLVDWRTKPLFAILTVFARRCLHSRTGVLSGPEGLNEIWGSPRWAIYGILICGVFALKLVLPVSGCS